MKVAAAGLTPISPTTDVVPVVETPDFARIAKLPADPRGTGTRAGVDVGAGVGAGVDVDVGAGVDVVAGIVVGASVGFVVIVGIGVDVSAGVDACVLEAATIRVAVVAGADVSLDVGVADLQADPSVTASIKMRDTVSPSRVFFIGNLM